MELISRVAGFLQRHCCILHSILSSNTQASKQASGSVEQARASNDCISKNQLIHAGLQPEVEWGHLSLHKRRRKHRCALFSYYLHRRFRLQYKQTIASWMSRLRKHYCMIHPCEYLDMHVVRSKRNWSTGARRRPVSTRGCLSPHHARRHICRRPQTRALILMTC